MISGLMIIHTRVRKLADGLKTMFMPLRVLYVLTKYAIIKLLLIVLYTRKRAACRPGAVLIFCMGGIGDVVNVTPFFENLRLGRPDWNLDVIAPFYATELLANNSVSVNRIISYPVNRCYMGLAQAWLFFKDLYLANYEFYFSLIDLIYAPRLPHSLYGSIVGFVASIPKRYGIYRQHNKGLGFFEKKGIDFFCSRVSLFNQYQFCRRPEDHITLERLQLLDMVGLKTIVKIPRLYPDAESDRYIRQTLARFASPKDLLILFCPTSTAPAKQWSPVFFAELAVRLQSELGAKVVVAGSLHENTGDLITLLAGQNCLDLSGEKAMGNLSRYVSLAKVCRVCIGLDSGLTHIAAAVSTPVVMLFGPTPSGKSRPLDNFLHRVIEAPKPQSCNSCRPWECPLQEPCINQITVDRVFQAVVSLWQEQGLERRKFIGTAGQNTPGNRDLPEGLAFGLPG